MSELDRLDRSILSLLQCDGRMPNATLAERVGLSASACLRRVQRLERAGIIASYAALLDARSIGRSSTVFVEVTLDSQREEMLDAFEQATASCPDILECHLIAGEYDYLLRTAVDNPEAYERLHKQQLSRLPHVVRIKTAFALRTVTHRTDYPI